jgi:hypothetical protein
MSGYDPKRNRPPVEPIDLDAPAPVDALLNPDIPAPDIKPPVVVPDPPIPVDVPVAPAPDRLTARLAIVGGVAAAATAAILLIRRSRRR